MIGCDVVLDAAEEMDHRLGTGIRDPEDQDPVGELTAGFLQADGLEVWQIAHASGYLQYPLLGLGRDLPFFGFSVEDQGDGSR